MYIYISSYTGKLIVYITTCYHSLHIEYFTLFGNLP